MVLQDVVVLYFYFTAVVRIVIAFLSCSTSDIWNLFDLFNYISTYSLSMHFSECFSIRKRLKLKMFVRVDNKYLPLHGKNSFKGKNGSYLNLQFIKARKQIEGTFKYLLTTQ